MQHNAETIHPSGPRSGGSDPGLDRSWVDARWAKILDRIDHRDPVVGLRFWGPPLWLEVTMSGPDSDRWPAVDDQAEALAEQRALPTGG